MGNISTKAALYLRKSTKDTRDSEHRSLADQKRDCLEQAKRMNLEVVHVYEEEEGVSRSHIPLAFPLLSASILLPPRPSPFPSSRFCPGQGSFGVSGTTHVFGP